MQNSDYADKKIVEIQDCPGRSSETNFVTPLAAPRTFNQMLKDTIRQAESTISCLSILMISVDFFEAFAQAYGQEASENCQKQISGLLCASLKRAGDLAAKFDNGDFACILSDTDSQGAQEMAYKIRDGVENLKIPNSASPFAPMVTVSIESLSTILTGDTSDEMLLELAFQALNRTKKHL